VVPSLAQCTPFRVTKGRATTFKTKKKKKKKKKKKPNVKINIIDEG
jgi:hypothetical protein